MKSCTEDGKAINNSHNNRYTTDWIGNDSMYNNREIHVEKKNK